MKSPYINEIQPNQVVTAAFLVQAKDVRQKKTGEPYLSLTLSDRTGEIDAKMWDNVSEVIETFDRDDFIRVKGVMQIYQNRPQLTIHKMQRIVNESEIDAKDYFPASQRDPDEMFAELGEIIRGIANPHLRGLLESLLADPEIARLYKTAPAAKAIHHAYLGGLLEHVLSLCALSRMTAAHYKNIDIDLLLTGVVLHDIGKIRELSFERSFSYSNDGQLLGHIIIGLGMVHDKLRQMPEFPATLGTLVEHMIISHHGELEYGSPKVPLFPEALLLHHLDNLDSKMECMRATAERDNRMEGCWTPFSPALERVVLKKARYLNGGQAAPGADASGEPSFTRTPARPASGSSTHADNRAGTLFADKLQQALRKES
ncbi:MAG: HD domain-containing protein [Bryobacterales bacterium]|nr:HD domain-containing protein [Bryobacterales bacterium]